MMLGAQKSYDHCVCVCVQQKMEFVYRVRAFTRDVHACRYYMAVAAAIATR